MKTLTDIITEKLVLNKSTKYEHTYNYHPKNRDELKNLLKKLIEERGEDADLNDIDVSEVHTFEQLFYGLKVHNIDLSGWDTSQVTDMYGLFEDCINFESANIANWDTSKVKDMRWMFAGSNFNEDISGWNVSKVKDMYGMFFNCKKFDCGGGNLNKWNPKSVISLHTNNMFDGTPLVKNPPKWYV